MAAPTDTATATGPAIIYCRVSTRGQEEHGTSLDSQERECVAHAATLGYTVGRITHEVYSGAELWDRPKLSQDRADLKAGQFAALICYSTDRLSRDPIHLAILAEECERAGVALHFVSETFDDSDEAALIRYVKGYSSKKEREKIRERSLRGKHQRALNGKIHSHGSELYGYRRDKEQGVRVIYPPEAAVVRQIFEWIAKDRLPVRAVVRRLNEQGVPPPSAGKMDFRDPLRTPRWGKSQIVRLLEHPGYKGEAVAWRWKGPAKPGGNATRRPAADWIRLPDGVTPPLVSPEVWQAAHDALRAHRGETTRNAARPYLLRGHIWCSVCGKRMQPMMENGTTTHPRGIYRCSSRDTASGACGGKRIPAEKVEAWAWERVAASLRQPDAIAAEVRRRQDEGPDPILASDLETARRQYAQCERAQAKLMQRYASSGDDAFPWELVEREVKRLEADKAGYQHTIAQIERRLAAERVAEEQLIALRDYCARVAEGLVRAGFGFDDKRLALVALAVRVVADGTDENAWSIHGEIPLEGVEAMALAPTSSARYAPRLPRPPALA
jgi:site-specific DNA recombinase